MSIDDIKWVEFVMDFLTRPFCSLSLSDARKEHFTLSTPHFPGIDLIELVELSPINLMMYWLTFLNDILVGLEPMLFLTKSEN